MNDVFALEEFRQIKFKAIGTDISVTYSSIEKPKLEGEVHGIFEQLESQASLYRSDSRLSVLNKSKVGEKVGIAPMLCALLQAGIRMTRETEGRFDITYKNPGIDDIRVNCKESAASFKRLSLFVDLNGIAAGFAADEVGKLLKARGVKDFLIDAGGEVLACGSHGGRPWIIGIEDPYVEGHYLKTLKFEGNGCNAVSTSGDYRRYIIRNGARLSFITDPKTGKSVNDAKLVTVVAKNATDADALSTAISVAVLDAEYIRRMKKKHKVKIFVMRGGSSTLIEY